ncbi:hypothetical protein AYL99_03360 [Fonsecaea erecta]|uniref:25S rRNA adenine-N(1) methyltransferase n=1 Tax=Fonsecaea erecta TaxID=1367422 RepID=A0A178ZMX3_9EURO|nr:hypothetical protein AYL99_03360 [Fonsecaea erecta]OAP61159.1 hypothetical protein AYL99_03360 [Fonsecaea erecta]
MAIPSQTKSSRSSSSSSSSNRKAPRRKPPVSLKSTRPPLLVAAARSGSGTGSKARAPATGTARKTGTSSSSTLSSLSSSLSSKHTRTLINTHHLLQKRLAGARARNDADAVRDVEAQIAAQGGLKSYQLASRTGQSAQRGGDSSRVLVRWLDRELKARKAALRHQGDPLFKRRAPGDHVRDHDDDDDDDGGGGDEEEDGHATDTTAPSPDVLPIRILEIGALSTQNALNVAGVTRVRRIDLRSAEEGIEEVDFMRLPLPNNNTHSEVGAGAGAGAGAGGSYYDVLSLSLVLNYVPDAGERGKMLRRTTLFFAPQVSPSPPPSPGEAGPRDDEPQQLPCLFLVLPSPCLHNSRYLTPQYLTAILNSLGYVHLHTKTTRKLHYSLWRFDGPRARNEWIKGGGNTVFKKKEINPGGGRNNFCIVLDEGDLES